MLESPQVLDRWSVVPLSISYRIWSVFDGLTNYRQEKARAVKHRQEAFYALFLLNYYLLGPFVFFNPS